MPASPGMVRAERLHTHVPDTDRTSDHPQPDDASVISDNNLEDKIPDKFTQLEDEWQQDPANPRNWSPARKWTTTAIVSSSFRGIQS